MAIIVIPVILDLYIKGAVSAKTHRLLSAWTAFKSHCLEAVALLR